MLRNSLKFFHRITRLTPGGGAVSKDLTIGHEIPLVRFLSGETGGKDKEEDDVVTSNLDVKSARKEIQEHFNGDDSRNTEVLDRQVSQYLKEKFVLYRDEDAEVILDVHEELDRIDDQEERLQTLQQDDERYQRLNLERGVRGVFDIDDLVQVLRSENAVDICTIQIPKELNYAEYLVLANGRSPRHLKAIIQFVRKMYKRKKSKKDNFLKTQGDGSDWQALDIGNIVLHVMLPSVRNKYDIETLWSVGEKYDRLSHQQEEPLFDAIQKHLDFLQEMQPISNGNDKSTTSSKHI